MGCRTGPVYSRVYVSACLTNRRGFLFMKLCDPLSTEVEAWGCSLYSVHEVCLSFANGRELFQG